MEPEVASSLISLAGVGTSNLANIWLNSQNNKQNAKQWKEYVNLQRELQNSQNAWNLAQWNRQNEYNSPANQMNLLRQAGLNPNLVYGNLAGASAGSLESAGADISSPTPNNAAQVSGFGDLGPQIGNMIMQKELNNAQIDKINTETEAQKLQNAKTQFELNNQEETYKNQQDNIKASTDSIRQNIEVSKKQLNEIDVRIGLINSQKEAQDLQNHFDNSTMYYRIRMVWQQYELNEKQKKILDESLNEIISRTAVNWSQAALNKSHVEVNDKLKELYSSQYMLNKQAHKWNELLNEATLEQIIEDTANKVLEGKKIDKENKYYLVSLLTGAISSAISAVFGYTAGKNKVNNKFDPSNKPNWRKDNQGNYIYIGPEPKTYW